MARPRFTRHVVGPVVASIALLLGLVATAGGAVSYSAIVNPTANIPARPNFLTSGNCTATATSHGFTCSNPCVTRQPSWPHPNDNDVACTEYVLRAINHARAVLHEPALSLPTNWYRLTVAEQLFTLIDLDRTSLGYPAYLGLNATLNAAAEAGAAANTDPTPPAGFAVGYDAQGAAGISGLWADDYSVLAADYGWNYADGWGGSKATTINVDCHSATSNACWDHRDELLGYDPGYNPAVGLGCATCEVGAGFRVVHGQGSYGVLIEIPASGQPPMTFTWAYERNFLTTHFPTPPTTSTTIPLPGPAVIGNVYAAQDHLLVSWHTAGPATKVVLGLFTENHCQGLIDTIDDTLSPAQSSGAISLNIQTPPSMTGPFFIPGHYFYVRTLATTGSGVTSGPSGCVAFVAS
jgi:hypothetical protein